MNEGLPEGFKMTELGPLPENWEVVRLGDASEQRKETVDPRKDGWKYVGLKHMDPGESRLRRLGFSDEVRSAKSKFYSGDVLYGKLRPYLDKSVLVDFEGICSTDIVVMKSEECLDEIFLSYLVHIDEFVEHATRTMTGVNHPRTSWRALSGFLMPLPPLPEQKRIAAVLSTVEEAKEKTEEVVEGAKEFKTSLMKYLFTYGPVPLEEAENVSLKETEIGMVPEGWEVQRLEDVAELIMGQSPPGSTYNEKGDGAPFLQGKAEFGPTSPRHGKYTTDPRKIATKGSVLMSVRAPVGDVNIANIEYCIGRGLASISLFEGNNAFLFYLLEHFKSDIEKEGTGSTFKAINKSKLQQFRIPLPRLRIQQGIVELLSSIDSKIVAEENKRKALEELFKTLLHNLMTAKIRVNDLETET